MSLRAQRYEYINCPKKVFREEMSTHHKLPRSLGGGNDERNLVELSVKKHQAWHTLFQNYSADKIAAEINQRYIDPDYHLVAVKRTNYAHVKSRVAVFSQRKTSGASIYD